MDNLYASLGSYLYNRKLGSFTGTRACQVAASPQPSDHVRFSIILQKTLKLQRNEPEVLHPLRNFCEKPSPFIEINPQSSLQGSEKFAKRTLYFHEINPPSHSSLRILIKSNHDPFHSLLLHRQHYAHNLNTKTR